MISNTIFKFLSELEKNNNKNWFDANRKKYEQAKSDFEEFVETLRIGLLPLLPGLADKKAKQLTFRIFRDVRFSKNKNPYKNNFGAAFGNGGKNAHGAGFYLHIEPDKCFFAAGIWEPEPKALKAIRQEIDYNFDAFEAIINDKIFKKNFGKLDASSAMKRPPKGYATDNPAIEYLKLKSFTAGVSIDDSTLTSKNSTNKLIQYAQQLHPFVAFINKALS